MLRPKSPQNSFYGSYLYDRIIPAGHLLRKINQVVDFSFVNDLVKDRYTPDFGRPAEDPEFMLRLCLLQYLYGDSDRKVIDNARMHNGYKFFLNLAIDEEVPDDTTGGYYGRLWRMKTYNPGGGNPIQNVTYTWDAGGNLVERQDVVASETEQFTYDSLDRLTGVTGPYAQQYCYDPIGNLVSKEGKSYTYGSKPHAATSYGETNYTYDSNGAMMARGGQNITWDYENRPVQVNDSGFITTFVYDGDGNRGKRTEGAVTTLYINKYFEKRVTAPASVTTYYYLGGKTVATRIGETLEYIHQDNLGGTSVMSNTAGNWSQSIKYYPYGETRSGSVSVSRKFTGQILDITGLYYYGARYYDPTMGRFISADTIIPHPTNPQSFNRYTYVLNNPLRYTDPTGHDDSDIMYGDPDDPGPTGGNEPTDTSPDNDANSGDGCDDPTPIGGLGQEPIWPSDTPISIETGDPIGPLFLSSIKGTTFGTHKE